MKKTKSSTAKGTIVRLFQKKAICKTKPLTMKSKLFIVLHFGLTTLANGQNKYGNVSLTVLADYDKYSFTSNFYTNQKVKGTGVSPGIAILYEQELHKQWHINFGAGYYKYNFNIARPFKYSLDTLSSLLYSTENYHYDCITASVGIAYHKILPKSLISNSGLTYTYYHTIGQKYKPFRHYATQKESASFHFANSVHFSYTIQKKINNYSIGLQLRLPIWESWRKDAVFKENQNEYYSKFLNGIGLGFIYTHTF